MSESMQPFLKEIADVRIGLTLRGRDASKQLDEEGLHLLRISDITEDGLIKIETLHPIPVSDSTLKFRVEHGDIVVANRGARMTAALVDPEIEAIAGGQIYVVRPDIEKVRPEYLWWFLNRPSTQRFLRYRARGSYVKTIPIQLLRDELAIPLPPMEAQAKIADFVRLAQKESEILEELSQLKTTYREALLTKMLTGEPDLSTESDS